MLGVWPQTSVDLIPQSKHRLNQSQSHGKERRHLKQVQRTKKSFGGGGEEEGGISLCL